MINSNAFDYINVLDATADAAWTRNEIIANNIANATTPGYKREDIDFENELRRALGYMKYKSLDEKVENLRGSELKGRTYKDSINYSYRLDENNVDIEQENIELVSNQLKYQGVIASLTSEFQNLSTAMRSSS
ncbi:MAG: flagellar basal body rod protein FlgB [Butyrivibrio sp.]|uniref:flagellar basal body rod protein FlgB n=1 Tax=Butyrivibrio sp. TaxID=28121 RepID=UPI0025E4662B|nr:flagellar basal body rod protein FlgB [Butyrivibrio sp.]MCR5772246.1 flagellar basal body rod protein FlgB [Butyrivibrio sp.]